MITLKKGNLITAALNNEFEVIVHGCNCFNTMGSGIAKQIKENFKEAYIADQKTKKGDVLKLGTCSYAFDRGIYVINAYTQYRYGNNQRYVEYSAVLNCMKWISDHFNALYKIGMPKIGSGLAGGDWNIIQDIIEEILSDRDVTIMYL